MKKVIAIKDTSYTGEFGLQELLDRSQDVLLLEDVVAEKQAVSRFLEILAKQPNKSSYGEAEVRKLLKMGAVELLLLSETLEDAKIEELETTARQFSSEVRIISTDTREGVQLKELGGIAAILRYEVHQ